MSAAAPVAIPSGWSIRLGAASRITPGAVVLPLGHEQFRDVDAVSLAFLRKGALLWDLPSLPDGDVVVQLDAFPAFDEALCAYFLVESARGSLPRDTWESLAVYAADVRQGMWPDKVAPELAVQSLYLALAQEHLVRDDLDTDGFVAASLAFFARLEEAVARGASFLREPTLGELPVYQKYVSLLEADQRLYREDVARGRRYRVRLPAREPHPERDTTMLVLDQPLSRLFKHWARRDSEAPGGAGYALLLVRAEKEAIVLSADPVQRISVAWLAPVLSEAQRAADPANPAATWYDGARHGGTLIAAPRDGTLSLDQVVRCLTKPLSLKKLTTNRPKRTGRVVAVASTVVVGTAAVSLVAILATQTSTRVDATEPVAATSLLSGESLHRRTVEGGTSAKGEPLPEREVQRVVSLERSGERPHYAMLAGACAYTGPQTLHSPCRDASAVRRLLMDQYGYRAENIIYLVDRPVGSERADGKPTIDEIKKQIQDFKTRYGNRPDSSFLFYYSGHGGTSAGPHFDHGYLQPSGFFSTYKDRPTDTKGWDMKYLMRDIKKGVPSKHIMAVLDACYSGFGGGKGDEAFDDRVWELWREHAEVVLTAGSEAQRAWEDWPNPSEWSWNGHSAMTAFFLAGLRVGASGKAVADRNGDGIVTDEEIAEYVSNRVPASVREARQDKQTPLFFRLDSERATRGQFLFVPSPLGVAESAEPGP